MYRGSVSTFADLCVAMGAAPCHVQRVRFWHLKSAYFLETGWGPPLQKYSFTSRPGQLRGWAWLLRSAPGINRSGPHDLVRWGLSGFNQVGFFCSSGLADVALRLGPEIGINRSS